MSKLVEEWRPVVGYEGLYEVSDWGKVKSKKRVVINRLGVKRILKEKILKPYLSADGYQYINLYKDKIPKTDTIHRLVARTFIPNPENKPEVDHIIPVSNGGTDEATNLRWVTSLENNNNPSTRKKMSEAQKTVTKKRDNYGRFLKNENRTN